MSESEVNTSTEDSSATAAAAAATSSASPAAASSTASPEKPAAPVPPSPPVKKERKKLARDLLACKTLLEDLEAHDEAWPFLLPVNTKQFPTYRKIIRAPMDLSTIKKRLTDGV
jgi:hypothetical protein